MFKNVYDKSIDINLKKTGKNQRTIESEIRVSIVLTYQATSIISITSKQEIISTGKIMSRFCKKKKKNYREIS